MVVALFLSHLLITLLTHIKIIKIELWGEKLLIVERLT